MICLFADDAKIGHMLQSSDNIHLQLKLANIDKWISTWQLELETYKCNLCVLINVSTNLIIILMIIY